MWKNQNVLITGGSQGIGLAVAQLLAKRQARLFLVARRKELLEQAIHSLP
ncbi:MAG: SDR family NAD(P)-dependent oxidoreductase, partial [Planctomycetota bacterium]